MTQVLGGALAAMTAAALGSRLGVGGTIIGAAVASIIAGVAGALYTASLRHTRDRVATVLTSRRSGGAPPTGAPQPVRTVTARRRGLPWKGVLAATVATFAVALVALTGLESLAGSALSGGRGTTIEQVTKPEKTTSKHKSDDSKGDGETTPTPSKSASPTDPETTTSPTRAAPTETPRQTPAPTPTRQPESSQPAAPTQEQPPAGAG